MYLLTEGTSRAVFSGTSMSPTGIFKKGQINNQSYTQFKVKIPEFCNATVGHSCLRVNVCVCVCLT